MNECFKREQTSMVDRGFFKNSRSEFGEHCRTFGLVRAAVRHHVTPPVGCYSVLAYAQAEVSSHERGHDDVAVVFLVEPEMQLLALPGVEPLEFCIGAYFSRCGHEWEGKGKI